MLLVVSFIIFWCWIELERISIVVFLSFCEEVICLSSDMIVLGDGRLIIMCVKLMGLFFLMNFCVFLIVLSVVIC